jgi:hypothetical protein
MEHLSYEVLCRMADGTLPQETLRTSMMHVRTCPLCAKEIELQRSILQAARAIPQSDPDSHFTEDVLNRLLPFKPKKWYEGFLKNGGALVTVAVFLVLLGSLYILLEFNPFQADEQMQFHRILGILNSFQGSLRQWSNDLLRGLCLKELQIFIWVILALMALAFVDRIVGQLFHQFKTK